MTKATAEALVEGTLQWAPSFTAVPPNQIRKISVNRRARHSERLEVKMGTALSKKDSSSSPTSAADSLSPGFASLIFRTFRSLTPGGSRQLCMNFFSPLGFLAIAVIPLIPTFSNAEATNPDSSPVSTPTNSEPLAATIEDSKMDAAVQNLGSEDAFRRIEAKNLLHTTPSQSIGALTKGLKDSNPNVRRQSLILLREFGPQSASEQIVSMARSEPDEQIRSNALETLRCIDHPALIATAKHAAETERTFATRSAALRVVGKKMGHDSIPWLLGFLPSSDTVVAAAAAQQLAILGDDSGYLTAINILKSTASSSLSQRVNAQGMALETLYALARPDSLGVLEEFVARASRPKQFNREGAIAALEHLKLRQSPIDNRIPILIDSLRSPRNAIRAWAAREFSEIGDSDPTVKAALESVLIEPGHPGQTEATQALQFIKSRGEKACP